MEDAEEDKVHKVPQEFRLIDQSTIRKGRGCHNCGMIFFRYLKPDCWDSFLISPMLRFVSTKL